MFRDYCGCPVAPRTFAVATRDRNRRGFPSGATARLDPLLNSRLEVDHRPRMVHPGPVSFGAEVAVTAPRLGVARLAEPAGHPRNPLKSLGRPRCPRRSTGVSHISRPALGRSPGKRHGRPRPLTLRSGASALPPIRSLAPMIRGELEMQPREHRGWLEYPEPLSAESAPLAGDAVLGANRVPVMQGRWAAIHTRPSFPRISRTRSRLARVARSYSSIQAAISAGSSRRACRTIRSRIMQSAERRPGVRRSVVRRSVMASQSPEP